jgi:hypothetical protein
MVRVLLVCCAVLITAVLVLVTAGLGTLLPPVTKSVARTIVPTKAPSIVGHLFFISSGQIDMHTSQGIADQVKLELTNITAPAAGHAYYAWLLGDDPIEGKAILLGRLTVAKGIVQLFYPGDQQHTNLLGIASRFLITEESAAIPPAFPSPDINTWRYSGQLSQMPNPSDTIHHFSLLSHLRHLLASDPTLQSFGLSGGLDTWFFRDMQKILEWAGSARDDWMPSQIQVAHRQVVRVLDYLDGEANVQNDVPEGTPLLVDPVIGKVGLLEFDVQNQEPPGYLYHIGLHLDGLVQSPGATAEQRTLATQIDTALNDVLALLQQMRQDAKQLVVMTDAQLLQPASLSLLDDLVKKAQDAFVGQFDPSTGEIQNGVTQIYYAIERLATLDVIVVSNKTTPGAP